MIDSIYSVLKTVLNAAEHPIPASNIWNFDETGHKTKYVRSFLYGLRGATKNNAESCGLGEHVTVGACANLKGVFLDPILLFTGAESNKSKMETAVREVGFANALILLKRGKASMDDRLFSIFLDWFGNSLKEKGFSGQHILFLDNHDSHERSEPISVAMKHGIILITFPSHCTHLVQMLDLSFFKPLKSHWKNVSRKWCDEECTDPQPYISKPIFLKLFYRAWVLAAIPENAVNGWKKMGLSVDKITGTIRIDSSAIPDHVLAASDKYEAEIDVSAKQSIRLCVGHDSNNTPQFEDFDFDLTKEGLETLKRDNPESYAMYCATKTYLLSQPGMILSQRTVRPCKIARPSAQLLTTTNNLAEAKEKDVRKAQTTTKKKTKALAQIGNELGVSVVVNGVDVVAAAKEKGQRIHYCPYCKKTLTRPCKKKKCTDMKDGKKETDPNASDDEETSKEEQPEPVSTPPVDSLIQVDIETGRGSKKCTETFYCTVQEYEADGAVILKTQDGESMNVFLEDYIWKTIYKCPECQEYGDFKLSCDACGALRADIDDDVPIAQQLTKKRRTS
jgi:hypothetical protein